MCSTWLSGCDVSRTATSNLHRRYSFRLVDLQHPPRKEKEGALDRFEIADDPRSDIRHEWVVIHENIDLARQLSIRHHI